MVKNRVVRSRVVTSRVVRGRAIRSEVVSRRVLCIVFKSRVLNNGKIMKRVNKQRV